MLVEWNDTAAPYPEELCIHQLVETQVARTPDAVAVVFEDQQLSYRELNQRANQLAHHLQGLGVGPETLVGISVERSLEMVIGLLGILKAGGAYLPLDPTYPAERLGFMLADAQVPVLLTQAHLVADLPAHDAIVICLDTDWASIAQQADDNPVPRATADNLAYVIYTSGSTGRPKGVLITHRGVCNRLRWMQDVYQLTELDRVLQKTPFSFDVSVWELFWPLQTGAQLIVARPRGHQDNSYLVNLIAAQSITVLHFVPSMLTLFLEQQDLDMCVSLRHIICSGEALTIDTRDRFFARLDAALHNLYGPTEASIDVTSWACDSQSKTMSIGRPIANTQIYLLDSHLQPVPIGVAGELHIGGVGLARGYLNRPQLTAERFIPNPFSTEPGTRLYKTGDLARYLPDGNIEYLGRLDHQVKIRGFRIELGEIEATLGQHPAVQEAIVLARDDDGTGARLAAYVVPVRTEPAPTTSDLLRFLQARLPDYMMPAAFMLLDTLPLTPSGKVDRRALPIPDANRPDLEVAYLAPRTPLEQVLAQIWEDVLGVERVGVHDNFFELGGHSLLAIQVVSRIRAALHTDLPLRRLFETPTIDGLATSLGSKTDQSERIKQTAQLMIHLAELSDEEIARLLEDHNASKGKDVAT